MRDQDALKTITELGLPHGVRRVWVKKWPDVIAENTDPTQAWASLMVQLLSVATDAADLAEIRLVLAACRENLARSAAEEELDG